MRPRRRDHTGNQLIGRLPVNGEGFTSNDIVGILPHFSELVGNVEVIDLNSRSQDETRIAKKAAHASATDFDMTNKEETPSMKHETKRKQ